MTVAFSGLSVRVAFKTMQTRDICSFELMEPQGGALPPFSAGSHVDVHLSGEKPGHAITRSYSLCNNPAERHRYQIAVLREPASRGGSQALHDRVRVGDMLEISTPKNRFALMPDADHSLLLAGGIGVTPLLCMAERLAATGASFELHYGARSREHAAFVPRMAASSFAERVRFHFDDEAPAQRYDLPALLAAPRAGTHLYVCGPKGFMDAVLDTARAAGWPATQLHHEFFSAEPAKPATGHGFSVKLARSGRVVPVGHEQTVVQALAACGVEIVTSCGQGVCGACLTRVLEGEPEHLDLYLSAEEQAANDQFLPCCSRAKSALLLLDL